MKIDIFKYAEKLPNDFLKRKVLDSVLSVAIPFNLSLGITIRSLSQEMVEVQSRVGWKTRNHVGGAHACFLALIGEYPAGLLLAQHYSPENFRMILGNLNIEYHKQARGPILSVASKPDSLPQTHDGEFWVDTTTHISNLEGEPIATAQAKWQLKSWDQIKTKNQVDC